MLTLRPYQQQAVDAVYRYLREHDDNPCAVLPTGCHAFDHPILMFDGSIKPVQNICVGDLLMGPDSEPRRVLALCRGEDTLYRITPNRGEPFVVNGDHILALVCTNEGKTEFPCYKCGGETEQIALSEYLRRSKSWRHLRKLYRVPVEFASKPDLPIPPYILGLLLGDGSIVGGVVELTTNDEVIADAWIAYAHSINCGVTSDVKHPCPTYTLVRESGKYNVVTEALTALELAERTSATKFIPHLYLTASRHDRLALFAGLMDSDGYANKTGCDYVTQSRELAADIVFLARSLGFAARCTEKYSTCQTGAGGWFFRLSIWGDFSEVPCRLERRQPPLRKQKKSVLRSGFRVEEHGQGNYYGFALDGDQLYLDGNFIVHHNSGKTPVMATICKDAVGLWGGRVLIVAHVKELLEQAADKLQAVCPELLFGIYSAGLGSRDTLAPVIIAGIQSAFRRADELGRFDLVIIDEAHCIPPDGDGMYRTLLARLKEINPQLRIIGLTATPFRMSSGPICAPENSLNAICFEVGIRELIVQRYLCPLITKAARQKVDTSGLHVRAGEFVASEVEQLMDDSERVETACKEIVDLTRERHACLIFASGVEHGRHVANVLESTGQKVAAVFGDTLDFTRDQTITEFKAGRIKFLVNVNVLTTGFDAPNIDCVVILRPTLSPGLWYQCCGRGFRLHPGKQDCLILDFGGNALRHGPVDALKLKNRSAGREGDAPAKECPQCNAVVAAGYGVCPQCGHIFEREPSRHDATAGCAGVLAGQVSISTYPVSEVMYALHLKRGAPPEAPRSMRVDYRVGFNHWQSEWICFEHTGFARHKAEQWWKQRSGAPVPNTAEEAVALAESGILCATLAITIRSVAGEDFPRIVNYALDQPTMTAQPEPDYVPANDGIPF